jgi:hypothetical protein
MQWSGQSRRLTTWVMVGLVLFAALAPSVSHAMSRLTGHEWVLVCSSQGSTWLSVGDSSPDDENTDQQGVEHCPFCTVHAPTLAAPPRPLEWTPTVRGAPAPQPPLEASPCAPLLWASVQARAPPRDA